MAVVRELPGQLGRGVQPLLDGGGGPPLDQVRQLVEELGACSLPVLPQGENLLELIEDQEGDGKAVARVPEVGALAVEELPEGLAASGLRRLDAGRRGGTGDRRLDLSREGEAARGVVEANVDWKDVAFTQAGEDAGLEERGLAEAGEAEENGQALAQDQAMEGVGLDLPALEEVAVRFAERRQARPRVLGVDRAGVGDLDGRAQGALAIVFW